MADREPHDPPEGHGTYGAERADVKGDHDPEPPDAPDAEEWADQTQRGGEAAS